MVRERLVVQVGGQRLFSLVSDVETTVNNEDDHILLLNRFDSDVAIET